MKANRHALAGLGALALLAGGCAHPSHLVFQQKTAFGIDAAADSSTGRVHVDAGYHRETNTFVPKTRVIGPNGEDEHEAMSVISLNDIKVKFLGTHEVNEQFATGVAAQLMADKPDALGQLTTLSDTVPSRTVNPPPR